MSARVRRKGKSLVLLVLLLNEIVLDEHVAEFVLKQVVALNLSTQILSQLLVRKDELFHCALLLFHIYVTHLSRVQCLLQVLNFASQLLRLLRAVLITSLVLHSLAFLSQNVQIDFLLVNDPPERVDHSFQFLDRLKLFVAQFDRVPLVRKLLTRYLGRLFLDCGQLFCALVFQVRRDAPRLKLIILEVRDPLLEPGILQVKRLLFELQIQGFLLSLKELFLQQRRFRLRLKQLLLQLFNSLLTALLGCLTLSDRVHWLANQHLDLVSFVFEFLKGRLQPILQEFFLLHHLAEFSLETNLHCALEGRVDLLQVEHLILYLLKLVDVVVVLRLGLHLAGWLCVFVNQLILELLFFAFEPEDSRVDVLRLFLGEQNFVVAFFDFVLQRIQNALVLLFDLPIFKLTADFAAFAARSHARPNFDPWLRCCTHVGRHRLVALHLIHLCHEAVDDELSRSDIWAESDSDLEKLFNFRVCQRHGQLLHRPLELNLVELSLLSPIVLAKFSFEVESLIAN